VQYIIRNIAGNEGHV